MDPRILYAFDSKRVGILLIGGDKTGNNRWYEEYVLIADDLYNEHIEALKKGG
ncbi:MAG TPA: type II toxin-antitoxin system RelE/ParE family toxin [Gammaproteobacteria bacterium]|nr:type II toxin-antitoxin system RelE/ParE family toxin [Gammaproteobacteria bacterium]